MLRLYAGKVLRFFKANSSTEVTIWRSGVRLRAGGLGFTLAQQIYLSLGAARSLPATQTRPWWPLSAV